MPPRKAGPVEAAARRDLADLKRRQPGVEKSAEAEALLALARDMDDDSREERLSSRVAAAREIREALAALRAAAPEAESADRLDELAARRDRRRAS